LKEKLESLNKIFRQMAETVKAEFSLGGSMADRRTSQSATKASGVNVSG